MNPKTKLWMAFALAAVALAAAYFPVLGPICQAVGACEKPVVEQPAQ